MVGDKIAGYQFTDPSDGEYDMMSHKEFPWFGSINSYKVSDDEAVEILILDIKYEEFLNQYGGVVLDKPIEQSFGQFLMRKTT